MAKTAWYPCPHCRNGTLAIKIDGRYRLIPRNNISIFKSEHEVEPVICLNPDCDFKCKTVKSLVANGTKYKKRPSKEPILIEFKEVKRWAKQNTYLAILNWVKKLGLKPDTARIWSLVKDEEMLNILKRPYWRKDEITCSYLLYYLIQGKFPGCKIEGYLLRKGLEEDEVEKIIQEIAEEEESKQREVNAIWELAQQMKSSNQ